MLILTAPAKTLDMESPLPDFPVTKTPFLSKTVELHEYLSSLSQPKLAKTLEVSDQLAELNYGRFQAWSKAHSAKTSRPALYTFKGDIFRQLDIESYKKPEQTYLSQSLCVLSGYYGLLRAFDLMQPYRLEMHLKLPKVGKLQEYWREDLTSYLNKLIVQEKHDLVLNLASVEYSSAVDLPALKAPVLTIDFKQVRNGQMKTFGLLAKHARGMMIDFCAKTKAKTVEDIKEFDVGGYQLKGETEDQLLFVLPA